MYAYKKPKTLEAKQPKPLPAKEKNASASAFGQQPQNTAQLKFGVGDTEALHGKLVQRIESQKNNTGLPDDLKNGIENLSGFSMGDVRVHYNSSKPAQLHAHAYTQGTEIHVAPGQEKHLPHEAWHVVQQMQGRVKPTLRMNGTNVNDNPSLEREATVLGDKANSFSGTAQLSAKAPSVQPCVQMFFVKNEWNRLNAHNAFGELKKRIIFHDKTVNEPNPFRDTTSNPNCASINVSIIQDVIEKALPRHVCTQEDVLNVAKVLDIPVDKNTLMTLPDDNSLKNEPKKPLDMTCDEKGNLILGIRTINILGNKDYIIKFTPQTVNDFKNDIQSLAQLILRAPVANSGSGNEGRKGEGRKIRVCHIGGPNGEHKYFWEYNTEKDELLITVYGLYMHIENDNKHYQKVYANEPGPNFIKLI